jgi:uncharacterized protein involved in outer membrane biogenesis
LKAFLITLGLFLVTALTAALIGPSFVDWSAYRATVETEAARLAGGRVDIGGALEVRILPRPLVRAAGVSFHAGHEGGAVAVAEGVELRFDLAALLLGSFEVSELTLDAPRLRVAPLLAAIARGREQGRPASRSGSLRRIEARDATLLFDDPFGAGTLTADGVDLQITAATLAGPFKLSGSYGVRGEGVERPTFSASVGSIDQATPVRIASRITTELGELSFDGALGDFESEPRYQGRVKLEHGFAGATPDGAGQDPSGGIVFEAAADLAPARAEFAEIRVSVADGAQALAFTGAGRASWDGQPRFSADFKARQIDLDATLGRSQDNAMAAEIASIAMSLGEIVRQHGLSGRVRVAVDGAIWRGELARELSAAFDVSPGEIGIASLQGRLPGETEFSLSGRVDVAGAPKLAGDLVVETIEAGRLTRWLAPESGAAIAQVLARSRGKYSIRGSIGLSEHELVLDAVDGIADGQPFSGSLAVAFEETGRRVRTDLAFDLIDLDRYLPEDARPADLVKLLTGPRGGTGGGELIIDARAKRVNWAGREAEAVELGLIAGDGAVDIAEFNIGRFAGAAIAAEGHGEVSPDGPVGALQVNLTAENLGDLLKALEIEPPHFLGLTPSLRAADLVLSIENGLGEDGTMATLSGTGEVSGTTTDFTVSSDAMLAEIAAGGLTVSVNVEASDASAIFGPHGLVPLTRIARDGGAGRVSVSGTGRRGADFELDMLVDAFGGVLEGAGTMGQDGTISADLDYRADRIDGIAAALGLEISDAAAALPARVDARLGGTVERLGIDIAEAVVAGVALSGRAQIVTEAERGPGTGAGRQLALALDSSLVSLPWLAGLIFAAGPVEGAENGVAAELYGSWPTTLIDAGILERIELEASGKAARLVVAEGTVLRDAEYALTIGNGTLSLTRLEGNFGAGSVAISGTAGAVDHGLSVEGEIEARGVALDRLMTDARGRELLAGSGNFESDFKARGRSLLSLVASLEGSGTFAVANARVSRFSAGTLFDIAALADQTAAIDAALEIGRGGDTVLEPISGKFEAANGRLKFGPARLAGRGFDGEATSFVDLASRRIDQELVLEQRGGAGVQVALIHAGGFGDVGREVEISDLPDLGSMRWDEPLDNLGVPMRAGDRTPSGSLPAARQANGAARQEDGPDLPPVGLIDQQIIDLPILEKQAPRADDGAG